MNRIKNIAKKMMVLAALAVLTLGGAAETWADTYQNVEFNSGVRYSQWAINSRIRDFRGNTKRMGFNTYNSAGELQGSDISSGYWWNNDTGSKTRNFTIDYVAGLVAKAIIENVDYNKEKTWAKPWYFSVQNYANQITAPNTGGSQDNMNAVKMYFALNSLASGAYSSLANASATTTKASTAFTRTATAFGDLNSNYAIGGPNSNTSYYRLTEAAGGWFHKAEYKDQMWCDGLYMGSALLAQLINQTGVTTNISGSTNDWEIIYNQIRISWSQLYDSSKGLLYHAFTASPQNNMWSGVTETGETFHSAAFWGRACGWYMLALVDILEQMKIAGLNESSHPQYSYYTTLKGYLNSLAEGIKNYQDNDTKCWYQVLDEKDNALSGNYIEASCSAIFTAAYFKGIRLGLYDKDYSSVAENAYRACVAQFLRTKEDGTLELINSCASAGLNSPSKTGRNGSRSYYISGSDVTKITDYTEGKIFGAFILAATEYERAYQASKAILFSTDLKASYDLEANESITIEACGADDAEISYEWYKVGEANAVATGATFTPTASGSYYCKATSGTTTIQSSTTNVTVAGDDTFTPEFTTNLSATTTATEGVAKTLTVAANHVDGYQWYSNTTASNTGGQAISGATSASYTFTPSATGTLYYYCVATNSKATGTKSVASNVCTVTVSEAPAGPTVLYSTDFSSSDWSGITNICNSSNAANETYNGITFHSYYSTAKPFVVNQSAGTMTWCSNNMGDNFWIAIPVTGVNGSLTITVDNGTTATRFKYATKQETTVSGSPGSGTSSASADPSTVTVNDLDKSNYVVYLGRQGSGLTTIKSITITTPAGGDPPTPTTYTVSYNMNGHGEAIADVTNVTALPSTLPTPTATGYIFGGWYTNEGLTSAAVAGASISANTTLYAKWTEKAAATVSINPNSGNVTVGSTLDISNYVTAGNSTGAISYSTGDASKATVTNAGVITGEAVGSATITISQAEDANYKAGSVTFTVTVNAAPVPTTNYTVKFWNGETQFGDSQSIEEGSTVSAPATSPTKDGYTFKGWALSEGSTARVLFPYPVYADVNFYAVWSNSTSGGGGEEEEIFKAVATTALKVAKETTNNNLSSYATITGGSMYANNGESSDKDMIKTQSEVMAFQLPNSSTIFKVTLNKALEAGDKINAETQTRTDTEVGLWLLTSTSRPKSAPAATMTLATASTAEWVSLPEYRVETGDGICGETTFYIHRCVGKTVYFTNFTITRESEAIGDDFTLETVSDYENFESYAGENKTVTFKRNFTEGKWTTLVLPFSVNATQLGEAFEYANDCELANIQSMTVNEQGTGSISYVTTNQITANTPVLAKIKPNDGLTGGGFTANEYVFSGVRVVNSETATATSNDGNVTMYGVYENTARSGFSSLADEEAYFLYNGKFYDFSWLSNMTPFTAYIVPQTTSGNALKGLTFEEDSATGIINLNVNPNRNSLSTGEGWGEVYNLAGQKVGKGYKGMVIKKGKKVIKK